MDLFGRLLDLSLENNAFPAAMMDLFQKNSSRLIKLIVTAHPNLSWHYGNQNLVWSNFEEFYAIDHRFQTTKNMHFILTLIFHIFFRVGQNIKDLGLYFL